MSVELANLIAKRFIARADVKAQQGSDGVYRPVRVDPRDTDSATVPWSRDDVLDHLDCKQTYGHYFLDTDSTTKLFAIDIDLREEGSIPTSELIVHPDITNAEIAAWEASFTPGNPREAWRDRAHPARTYLKAQFREIAERFASMIHKELGLDTAVAYSGNKGVHVYGFTGRCSAEEARQGAVIVLDMIGGFEPLAKQASTWIHTERWKHLSVEVYPKQDVLPQGGYGNLMRLPLGRNLKAAKDPTFFVDLTAPIGVLQPSDPIWSLSEGAKQPWALRGE